MTIRGYGGDSLYHKGDREDVMSIANFVVLNRYFQRRNQKIPIAPCDSLLTLLTRLCEYIKLVDYIYFQYTYLNGPPRLPFSKDAVQRFSILPHASIFFSLPRTKGNSSGGHHVLLRSPRFCFQRSRDRDSLCLASHCRRFSRRNGSLAFVPSSSRVRSASSRPCCPRPLGCCRNPERFSFGNLPSAFRSSLAADRGHHLRQSHL